MNQKRAHEEYTSSIKCNKTDRLDNAINSKRSKYDDLETKKNEVDYTGCSKNEPKK